MNLFVNPNGVLCRTFYLFGRPYKTAINVSPVFDGLAVDGRTVINPNDWSWVACTDPKVFDSSLN